jgi:hypothetical protein
MRFAVALVAIALAAGTGLLARDPVPLTKMTVRTMPERVLSRRLFGDLGQIMLPDVYHGHPGRRATRPLDLLSFATVPRAANAEGLCETQWVTVYFEPAGPLRGADTPVRPRRVASVEGYIVRDLARIRADPAADAEDEPNADAACQAIDPRNAHRISGRSEFHVQSGLRAVLALIDAAKEGRTLVPLDCSEAMMDGAPLGDAACLAAVGRLGIGDISGISACDSAPPSTLCYRISLGGFEMTLVTGLNGRQLIRATLESMIIMSHERID